MVGSPVSYPSGPEPGTIKSKDVDKDGKVSATDVSNAVQTGKESFKNEWTDAVVKEVIDFFDKDKDGEKYGFLPKMAIASRGSIGALMAASFCERINSCSNLVVTEGNSVLGQDLVEKVVMLRMNQGFIEMMRREYPQALTLKYPKFGSIVSPEDNDEYPQPSDKVPLRDCDME